MFKAENVLQILENTEDDDSSPKLSDLKYPEYEFVIALQTIKTQLEEIHRYLKDPRGAFQTNTKVEELLRQTDSRINDYLIKSQKRT